MSQPPKLLNDDGSASMATMLLLSHHAFRRDILRFIGAVERIKAGDAARAEAVREEWTNSFCAGLHGHHTAEDKHIFPDIKGKHPDVAAAIDRLTDQHHHIDPLVDEGNAAFADLANPQRAADLLQKLHALLDEHLSYEEASITPFLRDGKDFPTPPDEAAAAMYANGFAWSMQGIAPAVLDEVMKLLPENLKAKLPAARAAFEERCARVWGDYVVDAATTSVPDDYGPANVV